MELLICLLIIMIAYALIIRLFILTKQEREILKMIYYLPPASPKYERLFSRSGNRNVT